MVRRWFQRGMRPRMVKDGRYRSAYIFGAVCPARVSVAPGPLPERRLRPDLSSPWTSA